MVRTPWFDHDIPFEQAAEIGTRKVIQRAFYHRRSRYSPTAASPICPAAPIWRPRSASCGELKALEKPFVVVLNSARIRCERGHAAACATSCEKQYGVPVMAVDVMNMREEDMNALLESVLFEFPLTRDPHCTRPSWLTSLDGGPLAGQRRAGRGARRRRVRCAACATTRCWAPPCANSTIPRTSPGDGHPLERGRASTIALTLRDGLFYQGAGRSLRAGDRGRGAPV